MIFVHIANDNPLFVATQFAGMAAVARFDGGVAACVAGLVDDSVQAFLGGGVGDVEYPGVGIQVVGAVEGVVDYYF